MTNKQCTQKSPSGFFCTRSPFHTGSHVAQGIRKQIIAVWDKKEEIYAERKEVEVPHACPICFPETPKEKMKGH